MEMFLSGPAQVAGLIHAIWVTKGGNRRFNLDFFVLFKVEDGKIQSNREFGDTAEAIEAYRGKPIND
jgi:ketosteroid isomerase-like protein